MLVPHPHAPPQFDQRSTVLVIKGGPGGSSSYKLLDLLTAHARPVDFGVLKWGQGVEDIREMGKAPETPEGT